MMIPPRLRNRRGPPTLRPQQPIPPPEPPKLPSIEDRFSPSPADLKIVLAMLKSCRLPTELALSIIEWARYWPEQTFEMAEKVVADGDRRDNSAAKICLFGQILGPEFTHRFDDMALKLREVEFEIISEDQGWGGLPGTKGSYRGSSSWLEACILRQTGACDDASANVFHDADKKKQLGGEWNYPTRFQHWLLNSDAEMEWELAASPAEARRWPQHQTGEARRWPQDQGEGMHAWFLQANKVATRNSEIVKVVWSVDGVEGNEGAGTGEGFLRELRPDDYILVWARALWAGWVCNVSSLRMTVRYGL